MTVTKEYLDKKLATTAKDLKSYADKGLKDLKSNVDKRFDNIEKSIEDLAMMVSRGFDDVSKKLDVRERVEKLERNMDKVNQALSI